MPTGRKVFHCAVDETALTTNISEIKKWTTNGSITLVVPLYTLERLHALKRAGSQVAINAREAVRFLDRVTSGKDNIAAERVVLQGPMEQYERWEDAEKFFLPEFEEEPEAIDHGVNGDGHVSPEKRAPDSTKDNKRNGASGSDDLSQMLLNKLNFKKDSDAVSTTSAGTHSGPASRTSSRSSRTSPECANSHGDVNGEGSKPNRAAHVNGHQRTASETAIPTVPLVLRPLLSAILWRLHDGPDASNVAKSCILISNDVVVQSWAQKFGIGVKNIHQLRTSIQYEEREYKNRCKYVEKTQGAGPGAAAEPKSLLSYDDESEEDELVFVPRGRGKGTATKSGGSGSRSSNRKPAPSKNVAPPLEETMEVPTAPIDPDSFSRSIGGAVKQPQQTVDLSTQAGTSQGLARPSRGGRRGGPRGGRGNGRGRGKLWVP
ncbi:uncharacterized protein ACHE_70645S [Aspergillus chevalieri]|uniref:PIN domain-containing protein n=1 Tax=Aspergillus chevalieri TaxID=182096 RepID=A0A7R7ZSV0_ASPCH|nr:uncharacterized protein ACHE_70645S [Aspergillus chevalieri]BCR91802.1 hypothetical protein ACHE_70645S [Aspergillus chevalieri]